VRIETPAALEIEPNNSIQGSCSGSAGTSSYTQLTVFGELGRAVRTTSRHVAAAKDF